MGRALKSYAELKYRQNTREFDFHYRHLKKLITNMFKWEGLPDYISTRFLEDVLFHNGLVVFCENDSKILTVTRATSTYLNEYDEPSEFQCYSRNTNQLDNFTRNINNCVPIYNNSLMQGSSVDVLYFAQKLTNIDKAINVNLENLKQPYLISAPEGQEISVEKIMQKRANGEPFILTYADSMKNIEIKPFNFDIKNYTKELQEVKQNQLAEALTYYGINNVNIYKRERLTSGEVDQNNEQIFFNKESMLHCREQACLKINKMFNLNSSVHINTEICKEVNEYVQGADK